MIRGTLVAVLGFIAFAMPATATAFYGHGAQIVSADFQRLEQGDDTTVFAAISADGRYVAIQTRARNFFADDDPDPPGGYRAGGVFRFDLETRALEKVADGDLFRESDNSFLRRGASNPSISANGRYIVFTTAEPLLPVDTNDNADVYVRDMAIAIGDAGAFDLVSARDGGDVPASYGPPAFPFPGSNPGGDVSRGVAISADGQKVAFTTDAPSDLPANGTADVPADQIFLRDRGLDSTTLVTAKRDPNPPNEMTAEPAGGARGAALSADGTTVAWTGSNAIHQTRFLGGENTDPSFVFYLWRRVADGPDAPTRRITGLADPDDPNCPPDSFTFFDQTSTGPCYGPLTDQEATRAAISAQLPALSGDGNTVAYLTGAGPRPLATTEPGLDLFLTEMTPGLSRKQTTVELTRDTAVSNIAASPLLGSVTMASGGRYLTITTVRTQFALPALQLLGDPRQVPGPRELYVVDLQARTLDRVTRAYWGGDVDADVLNGATLSADGSRVAFASIAGNLFFGDANGRADAYVAERQPEPDAPPPDDVLADDGPAGTIEVDGGGPQIGLRAKSRHGGRILLTVSVPAAGGVKATARARAGRPRRRRTLATATARARGAARSSVRLLLRPVARYRRELRRRGHIRGSVSVSYVASRGGRRARASTRIVFRQSPKRRGGRSKAKK